MGSCFWSRKELESWELCIVTRCAAVLALQRQELHDKVPARSQRCGVTLASPAIAQNIILLYCMIYMIPAFSS